MQIVAIIRHIMLKLCQKIFLEIVDVINFFFTDDSSLKTESINILQQGSKMIQIIISWPSSDFLNSGPDVFKARMEKKKVHITCKIVCQYSLMVLNWNILNMIY